MKQYKILMHQETFQKAGYYQKALGTHNITAGSYLADSLGEKDISLLSTEEFVELLVRTKRPQIFAESDVYGDGSDWSQTELSILGDISIAVPVTVYDNGRHSLPKVHENPFRATLLYVPGALLRNGRGNTPADWDKVTMDGRIDDYSYYLLYEKRLLPAFSYANSVAKSQAFITIPGLGCGQFAGKFRGRLGDKLRKTLIRFIEHHGEHFPNVSAVYYDPYQECDNERHQIGHMSLFVRPLTKGNAGKSQLCQPQEYAEDGDDFSNCELFSFVAWDHVSWPGNDYYLGSRATDDGVKAAATDSMFVMTGVDGTYNSRTYTYDPPPGHINWENVVLTRQIQIQVKDNLIVLPNNKEHT